MSNMKEGTVCKHGVRMTGLVPNDCPKCFFGNEVLEKKECDHIVGFIALNLQGGVLKTIKESQHQEDYKYNYKCPRCPECGEKLNLTKDE